MRKLPAIGALWAACSQACPATGDTLQGFLCCNVYTGGQSVSDIKHGASS